MIDHVMFSKSQRRLQCRLREHQLCMPVKEPTRQRMQQRAPLCTEGSCFADMAFKP